MRICSAIQKRTNNKRIKYFGRSENFVAELLGIRRTLFYGSSLAGLAELFRCLTLAVSVRLLRRQKARSSHEHRERDRCDVCWQNDSYEL